MTLFFVIRANQRTTDWISWVGVYLGRFGIEAGWSGVKPYCMSGLLNSSEDSIPEFFTHWMLLATWMLAIVTGVDPLVFGYDDERGRKRRSSLW